MSTRKRFRLFLRVIPVVAILILLKAVLHELNLEFIGFDGLVPSLVGGSIFIIGFLLSHVLSDYKEAERMPGEMRVALEGIHDDVSAFAETTPNVDIESLRRTLLAIVAALEQGLGAQGGHSDLKSATEKVDQLAPALADVERRGMSQPSMVRLRNHQDVLRRCLYRIHYMQRMQFVPSVHVLVQTLVLASLFLLLFLRTEEWLEPSLIFGFVGYLFVYALFLIQNLEQPFRKGEGSVDDVSIFLLRDFVDKIGPFAADEKARRKSPLENAL